MGLLDKLFKKDKVSDKPKQSAIEPEKDPEMIQVFDGYGREFYITKQEWKDNILIGNLEKLKNNPDELYNMLVSALHDGFSKEIIKYAEILYRTDPIKSRAVVILGIVYMDCNRLDDAELIFTDYLKKNDEDGIVLTNLAKVYASRGDLKTAEQTLWHALEVDPNQENGLNWYAAIQKEREGESVFYETYRRIANLPKSWRAQIWLARFALEKKDIETAKKLYDESVAKAGNPLPADLLMQMSGDLGNNGYLKEIIQFVEPHFDPSIHGIMVGNNLIKTHFDLRQFENARIILDQLYTQKRQDWQKTLSFWDSELAKSSISIQSKESTDIPSVALLSLERPIWCNEKSSFVSLLPSKKDKPIRIVIFGNTTIHNDLNEVPVLQAADGPGRASRAIPLFLAEKIQTSTNAVGIALIAWAQSKGFAVFSKPYDEKALCELVEKDEVVPDYILSIIIDSTHNVWDVSVNIIQKATCKSLDKINIKVPSEDPGSAIMQLCKNVIDQLVKHSGINIITPPDWYVVPDGTDSTDYLLRLEQQLAVACKTFYSLEGGGLVGEHEIIDGILHLSVKCNKNKTVRIVLAQTLELMKKINPKILDEYKERITLLQKENPLEGDVGQLIQKAIFETMQ